MSLDGQAIRNANRGDSRQSVRANRFAENPNFHNVRAIIAFARIASNLRFAIFSPPEARFAKKGFSLGTLKRFARIGRFARICESIRGANFARIGPSTTQTLSGADAAPPPPCRTPGCSYTPVAALSAVSRVSQGCRSYTPLKGPCRTPSGTPL